MHIAKSHRRLALTSLRSVAAGAALAASFAPGALALDEVHLQTDWIPSGEHAAYYGAWSKGIFEKHGIDITITRGYGSGDTVTKLANGAFDFGVADFGAVLAARAKLGMPIKTIGMIYTHSPHSLFVLESSGIEDFQDLEGKRIGITPGNSHKLYFPKVAEKAGTDPSKIVWVNTDGATMAPLLIQGKLDAAPFYSIHYYYQNKAAEAAGEKIRVLPFEKVGFAIYAASLVTTDEMIEEKPELVERFLAATYEAFEWARENPEEACTLHTERVPEVAMDDCMGSLAAVNGFIFNAHSDETGLGNFSPERLAFTWAAVKEAQAIETDFDPAEALDTSLVPGE
ncbi:ABC transporter substrate-binding protein [Acuticoccus sp. MNP-M23]|uniref:ABC transporter substrate-binding protein n=1 Tax=Acuticoccus sp. MNP-M23 TaxID=3072793 RepID=UPI002814D282|nr:ABC transporter substrate-binding protein [Acuticoccus sp. MNP-M23]WMS41962.1 ABC transporter substrate-binding protein [Acuticoccus sp. MNP-M23]